jgi:hypothetical protein
VSTELMRKADSMPIKSMDDLARLSEMFAKSGYFTDARQGAQIGVKVLAGREMGFGPFASVNGVHIVEGKPSIGANLMAAAVKGSGRYNYRVKCMDDTSCEIEFFEHGESIGVSSFTMDDAKKANVSFKSRNGNPTSWAKFPRNMLFARALSNGVRWFCPDVFMGSAVYTPEELGADVDGEGNIVAPAQPAQPEADVLDADFRRAVALDDEHDEATDAEYREPQGDPPITADQVKRLSTALQGAGFDREHREQAREFASWLIDRDVESVKDLTEDEANRILLRWQDKRRRDNINPDLVASAVDEWRSTQQEAEAA